jgi:hypothetical protein
VIPFAHIAGIPVEETVGSLGPALFLAFGAAYATFRARLRHARSSAGALVRRRAVRLAQSDGGPSGAWSLSESPVVAATSRSPSVTDRRSWRKRAWARIWRPARAPR